MQDLIIIGAGPSGLTAGLYAGRYKFTTSVFEKMAVGGQIIMSASIENYPGFPGGTPTDELISKIKQQVDDLGVDFIQDEIVGINDCPEGYIVKTVEKEFKARSLILSVGAQAKRLGVSGEEKLIGRGVSYCATCDAPFFKNKDVVVVGGGDKALEEALYLTAYAASVTIIHRRQSFRGAGVIQDKVKNNPKIRFILDSVVDEIIGENKVEAVRSRNVVTKMETRIDCHGIFVFVGIKPNTDFLNGYVEVDKDGFIMVDADLKTSRKGIFACGDCLKKGLYQVVNACGEGAVAAYSVQKFLMEN